MLTIRGSDQVCTSLRAARKSLADGGLAPKPRIEELDLMIEELSVGARSYRGDAQRSKSQIEAFVTSLTEASGDVSSVEPHVASDTDTNRSSMAVGLHDALGHFRRAAVTLQQLMAKQDLPA